MKKIVVILIVALLHGCGVLKDRRVNKTNERVRLVENKTLSEKAPGDNVTIMLPYPLSNPNRPKATIQETKGKYGATVKTQFDSIGMVNRIDVNCPEIDKVEQHNLDLDYSLREKEIEVKANIELANVIGKWLAITFIPIGGFFALALYFKSRTPTLL